MLFSRSTLANVGLVMLVVVVGAGAFTVLTRTPEVASTPDVAEPFPSPTPTPSPSPTRAAVRALFIGADEVAAPAGLAQATAAELGWQVTANGVPGTGFASGPPGQSYVDRVPRVLESASADVVVIAAGRADAAADGPRLGGNAQFVAAAVRDALPRARIILVGPVGVTPEAFQAQREVLTAVAARFGAFFVDPVGGRYLFEGPLVDANGLPNAAGYQEFGRRLAGDLRRVLPRPLLPLATPTASPS